MTIEKAPFMRPNMTQHLLQGNNIDFWGNDTWLVNSPDLNAAEHIGAVIKNEVDKKCFQKWNMIVIEKKTHFKCFNKYGNEH